MRCIIRYVCVGLLIAGGAAAQTALTWQQVVDKFRAANPNLRAGQLNIQESKAAEITAYLRPNPNLTMPLDQIQPFNGNPYRPFGFALPLVAFDYLHERQHKRELRLESAQQGTAIAESQQQDLERNLLFNLRSAFVQTLQAKALLANAKENLDYFDKELAINRDRFKSGDIARVDLDRIALQRVQYESDFQTALVNARTAKITLLMLLNERTPVDQFDVTGPFEFQERIHAAGRVSYHGAGGAAGLEGGPAGGGKGRHRSQTGGGQRFHRPHFRRGLRAQSADPGLHGGERQHPAADFRPQPGREGADRRSTSRMPSGRRTRPRRRCSATWIRRTSRW